MEQKFFCRTYRQKKITEKGEAGMCGRYYVDDTIAGEIEKMVQDIEVRLRNGDVYPSQTAMVLTGKMPGLRAEEMIQYSIWQAFITVFRRKSVLSLSPHRQINL